MAAAGFQDGEDADARRWPAAFAWAAAGVALLFALDRAKGAEGAERSEEPDVADVACRAALAPLVAWADARGERGAAEFRARHRTCVRAVALAEASGADPALVAAVGYAGGSWRLDARSRGGCCAGPFQCAPRHHCPVPGQDRPGGPAWSRWAWHPTEPGLVVSPAGLTCDVLSDCIVRLTAVAVEERDDEAACGRWSGGPGWRSDPARRRRARWMAAEVRRVRRAVAAAIAAAAGGRPET